MSQGPAALSFIHQISIYWPEFKSIQLSACVGYFFLIAFLRCNLDAIKITCLKCTIQWVPVYLLSCAAYLKLILKHLYHSPKSPSVHQQGDCIPPPTPQPLATTNLLSPTVHSLLWTFQINGITGEWLPSLGMFSGFTRVGAWMSTSFLFVAHCCYSVWTFCVLSVDTWVVSPFWLL